MKISFQFDESEKFTLTPETQADRAKLQILTGDGVRKAARISGTSEALMFEAIEETNGHSIHAGCAQESGTGS